MKGIGVLVIIAGGLILDVFGLSGQVTREWGCLVHANPVTGGDMSTVINSDQWEYYLKKYPGSYKGKCRTKGE